MLNREEIKNLPQLLTPHELAEAMGISLPFCYKLIRTKGFPSFRVGKKWLIATDKLMEWIDLQADSDVGKKPTEVEWLWYPYIPYGKITIIQGDPGEGKTTLILNLAAMLSKGDKLPESEIKNEPINIIYQTAEDGLADTVKPRLIAADADYKRITVIDESTSELSFTDERLEQAIIETKAKLVILDPLQAYIGASVDMHRANEIRPIMKHLAEVAQRQQCAVVLIGHLNKAMGMKSSYRGLGSIDIPASARSVLLVGRIKDNPTVRVMAQVKSSLAPEGEPIAFELNKETGFRFIGKYNISIDDLLNGTGNVSKVEQAEKFLMEFLSDGTPKQQKIIQQQASYRNIGNRTLNDAKKNLNIKSFKKKTWFWQLPN